MVNQLLQIDQKQVERARQLAVQIARDIQREIDEVTTVSIERTVARLFGIDGTNSEGVPLPNVVVDQVAAAGKLHRGIAFWPVSYTHLDVYKRQAGLSRALF